jgi:hypothetical protein
LVHGCYRLGSLNGISLYTYMSCTAVHTPPGNTCVHL